MYLKKNKKNRYLFLLVSIFLSSCNSSKIYQKDDNQIINSEGNINYLGEDNNDFNIQELNNNTIYFDFDKYEINPKFFPLLNNHAKFLNKNKFYNIIIEGHTDERGTSEYNIVLGENRAQAVKDYLKNMGVQDKQISIVSYGKEKPAVSGHNNFAYSKNRRVVITY